MCTNEQTPKTPICEINNIKKNPFLSGFILIAFAVFWAFTSSFMWTLKNTYLCLSISFYGISPKNSTEI